MKKIRHYQGYVLGVVALFLVLKSMLPFGVMPSFGEGKSFTLEICMGNGSLSSEAKQIQDGMANLLGTPIEKRPTNQMVDEKCAFAFYTGQHITLSPDTNFDVEYDASQQYIAHHGEAIILANIARSFSVRAPPFYA